VRRQAAENAGTQGTATHWGIRRQGEGPGFQVSYGPLWAPRTSTVPESWSQARQGLEGGNESHSSQEQVESWVTLSSWTLSS
jgi:hypothetical protein